jgi:hypothetical protein
LSDVPSIVMRIVVLVDNPEEEDRRPYYIENHHISKVLLIGAFSSLLCRTLSSRTIDGKLAGTTGMRNQTKQKELYLFIFRSDRSMVTNIARWLCGFASR